ncbi:hypothetical protein [Terrimonas sp.]|nr:hypothetical protein [Terrimonas sp.]
MKKAGTKKNTISGQLKKGTKKTAKAVKSTTRSVAKGGSSSKSGAKIT